MATFTLAQPLHLPALHHATTNTAALAPASLFGRVTVVNPPRNFPSISISSKSYLPPKAMVSSFAAITVSDSTRAIAQSIQSILSKIVSIAPNLWPLLAAIAHGHRSRRAISTPLTPVAVAMSKCLDVYWVILQIRVVQVWFPDIPWDRPLLSVIGDMVDPYLSLIRRFSPPVFNILNVSPFYAAVLLEVLSVVLNANLTANSPYYANLHSHY